MKYTELNVEQLAKIACYEDEQCNGRISRNTYSQLCGKSKDEIIAEMLDDGCMDDENEEVSGFHLEEIERDYF